MVAECVECQPDTDAAGSAGVVAEDLLDPSTFIPPLEASTAAGLPGPAVIIEVSRAFSLVKFWAQTDVRGGSVLSTMQIWTASELGSAGVAVYVRKYVGVRAGSPQE